MREPGKWHWEIWTGDGDLDAWIALDEADSVWLNDGKGNFTDSGQSLGSSYSAAVRLTDTDRDGDLDAITVGWDEDGTIWFNDGAGNFAESKNHLSSGRIHMHGMTLGDVTGDGIDDAILTGSPNQLWFNDGTGTFINSDQRLASQACDTAALGDFDGDGDLDAYLAVGTTGTAQDQIWINQGDGYFAESDLILSMGYTTGVGIGDLDGDSDPDFFIAHGELGKPSGGGLPNEVWFNGMQ